MWQAGLTATWRDTTAEIGNAGNLFIEISLSNAVIEGLIQDVSVGSLTATIAADEAGPGIINIVIQSPDGPMYTVTDESAVGTLWCSNVWPPGSTGECRLQITWSGRWNTRPISGVITSVTSGSALDGGTSAITDTTVPTMRISGFKPRLELRRRPVHPQRGRRGDRHNRPRNPDRLLCNALDDRARHACRKDG
jgi:hypothetical protein